MKPGNCHFETVDARGLTAGRTAPDHHVIPAIDRLNVGYRSNVGDRRVRESGPIGGDSAGCEHCPCDNHAREHEQRKDKTAKHAGNMEAMANPGNEHAATSRLRVVSHPGLTLARLSSASACISKPAAPPRHRLLHHSGRRQVENPPANSANVTPARSTVNQG